MNSDSGVIAEPCEPSPVAAMFVRADSVYKTIPGVDCWDIDRDARLWPGGCPVVAHPPCRAWGRLRHLTLRIERKTEPARSLWLASCEAHLLLVEELSELQK